MGAQVIGLSPEPSDFAAADRGNIARSFARARQDQDALLAEIATTRRRIAEARTELQMASDPEADCVRRAQRLLRDELHAHEAAVAIVVSDADAEVERVLAPLRALDAMTYARRDGGERSADADPRSAGPRLVPFLPDDELSSPGGVAAASDSGDAAAMSSMAAELVWLERELDEVLSVFDGLERQVELAQHRSADADAALVGLQRLLDDTIAAARAEHRSELEHAREEGARRVEAARAKVDCLLAHAPLTARSADVAMAERLLSAGPPPSRPPPSRPEAPLAGTPLAAPGSWPPPTVAPVFWSPPESGPPPVAAPASWSPPASWPPPAAPRGSVASAVAGPSASRPSAVAPGPVYEDYRQYAPHPGDGPGTYAVASLPRQEVESRPSPLAPPAAVRMDPPAATELGRRASLGNVADARPGLFLLDVLLPLIAVAIVLMVVLSWIG